MFFDLKSPRLGICKVGQKVELELRFTKLALALLIKSKCNPCRILPPPQGLNKFSEGLNMTAVLLTRATVKNLNEACKITKEQEYIFHNHCLQLTLQKPVKMWRARIYYEAH